MLVQTVTTWAQTLKREGGWEIYDARRVVKEAYRLNTRGDRVLSISDRRTRGGKYFRREVLRRTPRKILRTLRAEARRLSRR